MQKAENMVKPTFEQLGEFHDQAENGRVTRKNFQNYLRNPEHKVMEFPSSEIAAKYGCEVEADVKPATPFDIKSFLKLVPFLEKNDGGQVTGTVMRGRAIIREANLGLVDAQYVYDHQNEIPVEFRCKVIVFAGTLVRDSAGSLCVPCLYWSGGRWILHLSSLDVEWPDDCGLASRT